MRIRHNRMPGILLAAVAAVPAWILGEWFPVVGSPVLGILFGMGLAIWRRPPALEQGITFTSKYLLQYSIIFLGLNMNLYHVIATGKQTVLLILCTLTVTFLTAYLAGKWLGLDTNTKVLIGVGTAICGGSAIAATAPAVHARDEEVARSISTIFLFNVIAAVSFPMIGHLLQMSNSDFGTWAGTAINDTSAVVAAGYTYSNSAGDLAVIVKLTRTLLIIPVTLFLAYYTSRRQQGASSPDNSLLRSFPWFILGFVAAAVLNTFGYLSPDIKEMFVRAGKFMIVMAMVAIGLNSNPVKLVNSGWKPILLGLCCSVVLAVTSLVVQLV